MKSNPEQGASRATVAAVLRKVLPDAALERIPRHPDRRAVVLALLCADLQRRYPYSEVELNEVLQDALATFNASVDHVTCRRYLVDLGFVRRNRAGTRYLLNYPKLEAILSPEALTASHELLEEALNLQRNVSRSSQR